MVKQASRTTKPQSRKGVRKLYLALAVFVLLTMAGTVAYKLHHKATPAADSSGINLAPATADEKADSDRHKEIIVKDQEQAGSNTNSSDEQPSTKKSVDVIIVGAGQSGQQVSVRSYVSGIIEDNGTCIATFSQGSTTFTKQTTGVADATTTLCGKFLVDSSSFPTTGTWSVTVSYDSSAASGTSKPVTFEVK